MNLFRLIAFALLVWIAWLMLKNYLAKQRNTRNATPRKPISGKIVKCQTCDLHLPEADAVSEGDAWFCCQAHRHAWIGRS